MSDNEPTGPCQFCGANEIITSYYEEGFGRNRVEEFCCAQGEASVIIGRLQARITELEAERDQQSAPAMPQADWANAPAWAMWWAVDADGQSAFYGSEPCIYKLGWSINGFYGKNYVNSVLINIPLGIDWRQTLQRRPAS